MTGWQCRAATLAQRHHLLHDPATHALDLASEVGEVAKEVLLATNYGRQAPQFRSKLADELGMRSIACWPWPKAAVCTSVGWQRRGERDQSEHPFAHQLPGFS